MRRTLPKREFYKIHTKGIVHLIQVRRTPNISLPTQTDSLKSSIIFWIMPFAIRQIIRPSQSPSTQRMMVSNARSAIRGQVLLQSICLSSSSFFIALTHPETVSAAAQAWDSLLRALWLQRMTGKFPRKVLKAGEQPSHSGCLGLPRSPTSPDVGFGSGK